MKKNIPNIITLMSLFCGCLGIVAVFHGYNIAAAAYVGIAAIFDFSDGFVARLLKAQSELGKQLDSLADLISFGLLPSFIIFFLFHRTSDLPNIKLGEISLIPLLSFLIAIFSALRLAKFNIDTRQAYHFIGLPTPANAVFFASFVLIEKYPDNLFQLAIPTTFFSSWVFLSISIIMFSLLLVSEIPLFSLKFKQFTFKKYFFQTIFLIISLILSAVLWFWALPLIILIYIVLSLIARKTLVKN